MVIGEPASKENRPRRAGKLADHLRQASDVIHVCVANDEQINLHGCRRSEELRDLFVQRGVSSHCVRSTAVPPVDQHATAGDFAEDGVAIALCADVQQMDARGRHAATLCRRRRQRFASHPAYLPA